jgi:hypothetical protein
MAEPSFSTHPPGKEFVVCPTAVEAKVITSPPNKSQSERFDMSILRLSGELRACPVFDRQLGETLALLGKRRMKVGKPTV